MHPGRNSQETETFLNFVLSFLFSVHFLSKLHTLLPVQVTAKHCCCPLHVTAHILVVRETIGDGAYFFFCAGLVHLVCSFLVLVRVPVAVLVLFVLLIVLFLLFLLILRFLPTPATTLAPYLCRNSQLYRPDQAQAATLRNCPNG